MATEISASEIGRFNRGETAKIYRDAMKVKASVLNVADALHDCDNQAGDKRGIGKDWNDNLGEVACADFYVPLAMPNGSPNLAKAFAGSGELKFELPGDSSSPPPAPAAQPRPSRWRKLWPFHKKTAPASVPAKPAVKYKSMSAVHDSIGTTPGVRHEYSLQRSSDGSVTYRVHFKGATESGMTVREEANGNLFIDGDPKFTV